jgi:beta-galactosidase
MINLLLSVFVAATAVPQSQVRQEINLTDWQFSRDMITWQSVKVPHDWAISGPFDKKWDMQVVAIEQNGEKEKTEHTGRSGSLPWIGEGEYKTTFTVPKGFPRAMLCFDGAMSEPVVSVNGQKAGEWKYGYNAFRIDITPFLKKGENSITVHLTNRDESSRWYPGAGLYRPVKLVFTGETRIDPWMTFFRTNSIAGDSASVTVGAQLLGYNPKKKDFITVELFDSLGHSVVKSWPKLDADGKIETTMSVPKVALWSPEHPNLYKLVIVARRGWNALDVTRQNVGIRTISVSKEHGFQLNGVTRKIKGVCIHHDLGPIGTAVDKAALIRQIRIMKDMGADAIRTSHNMPSTMQMNVCDSMGMMVMAESFDTWKEPKVKNGYGLYYDEWWNKDITNLVLNHRNHPSIVMWSIGNEIPEQWKTEGAQRAKAMTQLCHQLDPTRPVTAGSDNPDGALKCGYISSLDIPGFNYRLHRYDDLIKQLPQGFILGSETASTISSRGVYDFPDTLATNKTYADGQCSSYDTEYCWWSNLPDADFLLQDDRPWTIGQFVWTGFDYLGEPTPYDAYWPSRSSYFGICDLAGLPKDRYYLYRSVWNKDSHTLHVLPHWTWADRYQKVTPVYVYTDYPEAELFINGKSQGKKSKNMTASSNVQSSTFNVKNPALLDRYRMRWEDVKYEPGKLKVIAYDAHGNRADSVEIHTADTLAHLVCKLEPLNAYDDLAYIDITAIDDYGNECPDANDEITFTVSGDATFRGACNGDATSLEQFTQPRMRLFHGKLVAVVNRKPGSSSFTLTCQTAKGIKGKISNTMTLVYPSKKK